LFFAGQVNGTSGYEEAAAQGLMAGINAARSLEGRHPVVLGRHEAYIGVLIDDLVTKDIDEPYRMFTSRAEHRLILRQDNADERLFKYGVRFGLLPRALWARMIERRVRVAQARRVIDRHIVSVEDCAGILGDKAKGAVSAPLRASQLLQRPGVKIADIEKVLPEAFLGGNARDKDALEIQVKYEGYIRRQRKHADRMLQMERTRIPKDFSYDIKSLSAEARLKLGKHRPLTLGQAARLSGVRSSDLSILMIYLIKLRREKAASRGARQGGRTTHKRA
jgi:tRNA uridine 5-carboxymethylaminomethyl modification enzyme